MAKERSTRAINHRGKNKDPSLMVRTEENEVSKIFIIGLCLTGSGTILFMMNSFKFLKQVKSKKVNLHNLQ